MVVMRLVELWYAIASQDKNKMGPTEGESLFNFPDRWDPKNQIIVKIPSYN